MLLTVTMTMVYSKAWRTCTKGVGNAIPDALTLQRQDTSVRGQQQGLENGLHAAVAFKNAN